MNTPLLLYDRKGGYTYSGTLPKRGWVSSLTQCRSWEDVQHSLDTSQLGEVMNVMSHITTTLYSQPPPSTIPQPAPIPPLSFLQALPRIPHISRNTSRHRSNTAQHQHLQTDTNVLSLTPACTTSCDVSNPAPVFATQRWHLQPNTYILSPTPASTTSTNLYNPTPACTTPIPTCKALFQAKHQHVQPNASKRQMARIWWEPT